MAARLWASASICGVGNVEACDLKTHEASCRLGRVDQAREQFEMSQDSGHSLNKDMLWSFQIAF